MFQVKLGLFFHGVSGKSFIQMTLFVGLLVLSLSFASQSGASNCQYRQSSDHWSMWLAKDPIRKETRGAYSGFEPVSHSQGKSLFVENGKGQLWMGGARYKIRQGDFIYIPPMTPYLIKSHGSQAIDVIHIYSQARKDIDYRFDDPIMGEQKPFILSTKKMRWNKWHPKDPVEVKFLLDGNQSIPANMVVGLAKIPPGKELLNHYHAPAEFYYILSGTANSRVASIDHVLKPGQSIYIPENAPHHTRNLGKEDLVILFAFPESRFGDIQYMKIHGDGSSSPIE